MKICYIAEGSSIHTLRWLNYFATHGHEVHLIYWQARPDYDKSIHIHYLKRFAPKIWPVTRYISFLQWIFQVRKLVTEIKPDVLDTHFIIDNGVLGVGSGFHPVIATAWGSDVLIFPQRNILWRMVAQFVIQGADKVLYNSEVAKAALLNLGASPAKLTKYSHGIDIAKFSPRRADVALKKQLGTAGSPAVISIRHLRPLYNVEMLVRAIPLVLKQAPQTRFIIAGEGEQKVYLQKLAADLGVAQNVKFIGYINHEELPGYLASSDIYVTTSRSDSSPQSLQEAMACELAPVVTDLPANREWIQDGENGFIVPQNDSSALAEKILYLVNDPKIRTQFGKLGRTLIREKADYEKEMAKVEKIYETLANKS